jgi:hypothetical protein
MGIRIKRVCALSVLMLSLPATAYAVNVSSNDGSGTQTRTSTLNWGGDVTGKLKSTAGKSVYYSGRVAISGTVCPDLNVGRYSTNTSSLSLVDRGGRIFSTNTDPRCTFQGVKSRICTVKNNLPDPCGTDSSTY